MGNIAGWIKRPTSVPGLDPLGSQAPCINLYGQLLPGITNVTDRARYYSLYPWFVWAFDRKEPKGDLAKFEELYRRADCLFTLIAEHHARTTDQNNERHGAAMVGRLKLLPALTALEAGKKLSLSDYATRDEVPKRYFMNRLGGLGQYYAGTLFDLGLMEGGGQSWMKYTKERGAVIAQAVEKAVDSALFFKTIKENVISLEKLEKLSAFCPCKLGKSMEEHTYLVDMFFDRKGVYGEEGKSRRRSLGLLLKLVDDARDQDVNDANLSTFRGCVYGGSLGDKQTWQLHESLRVTREGWSIYQRNEMLSLSAQAMFCVGLHLLKGQQKFQTIEEFGNWFSKCDVVTRAVKSLKVKTFDEALLSAKATLPSLADWRNEKHEFQICELMLSKYYEDVDDPPLVEVVAAALRLAVALSSRDDSKVLPYGSMPFQEGFLADYPINLASFRRAISESWSGLTMQEFAAWLVREWGLNTHLHVALRKFRHASYSTFRVRPTDQGLLVENDVVPPARTNPRLWQAFQILLDIGATTRDTNTGTLSLTKLGKSLLENMHEH